MDTWKSSKSQEGHILPPLPRLSFARHRSWTSEPGVYKKAEKPLQGAVVLEIGTEDGEVGLLDILEKRTVGKLGLSSLQKFVAMKEGGEVGKGWKLGLDFCLEYLNYRNEFLKLPAQEQNASPPPFQIIEELVRKGKSLSIVSSVSCYSTPSSVLTVKAPIKFATVFKVPFDRLNASLPPTPHEDPFADPTDDVMLNLKSPPIPQSVVEAKRLETLQKLGEKRQLTWKEPTRPLPSHSTAPTRHTQYSIYSSRLSTATTIPDFINPSTQPLRRRIHEILYKYLKQDNGEVQPLKVTNQAISQAFLEAKYTTSPDVLHPIFSATVDHLSDTLLPAFLRQVKFAPESLSEKVLNPIWIDTSHFTPKFNLKLNQKACSTIIRILLVSVLILLTLTLSILSLLDPFPLSSKTIPRFARLSLFPLFIIVVALLVPCDWKNKFSTLRSGLSGLWKKKKTFKKEGGVKEGWTDIDDQKDLQKEKVKSALKKVGIVLGGAIVLQGGLLLLPYVDLE